MIYFLIIIWMVYYHCIRIQQTRSPRIIITYKVPVTVGIQTTLKDGQAFIASRIEKQQLKESRHTKQSQGHIMSYNSFNRLHVMTWCFGR